MFTETTIATIVTHFTAAVLNIGVSMVTTNDLQQHNSSYESGKVCQTARNVMDGANDNAELLLGFGNRPIPAEEVEQWCQTNIEGNPTLKF